MTDIILHHYALSPFSEKMRRIFAYKGVVWHGVEQPIVAPKPDLTPLTGGYRRIPVLQIGADIYCDTALMARVIEQRFPTPACIPLDIAGIAATLEDWADHRLFMQVVPPVVVELLPALPPEFIADRSAMSSGFSKEALSAAAPQAFAQTCQSLDLLELMLNHKPYLLGEAFSVADAACFHCVWFLQNSPRVFAEVSRRPALARWFTRIQNFNGGRMEALSNADALAIAKRSEPSDIAGGCAPDDQLKSGNLVSIGPDDYGKERTEGRIVRLSANEIVVLRSDPVVGDVAVHFPRAGYHIGKIAG
jgi:glutathione S-transferase